MSIITNDLFKTIYRTRGGKEIKYGLNEKLMVGDKTPYDYSLYTVVNVDRDEFKRDQRVVIERGM